MSLFTRFPVLRFLVFGSIAVVVLSSPLRAQDLRQWMPNVGDKFTCSVFYSCNCGIDETTEESDTIEFMVIAVKAFDSVRSNVIVTANKALAAHYRVSGQIFSPGDTSSISSFQDTSYIAFESPSNIETSITTGTIRVESLWAYLLSVQHDAIAVFQGDTLSSVFLATDPIDYGQSGPWHDASMNFIPTLGWFLSLVGENEQIDLQTAMDYESWNVDLISASRLLGVSTSYSEDQVISITGISNLLTLKLPISAPEGISFNLVDLLGRPIRAWSLVVSAGEIEVSLNVADVPSGIYFLHVSAAGVDEMRKVVIVH